jgi:hypothetical protein
MFTPRTKQKNLRFGIRVSKRPTLLAIKSLFRIQIQKIRKQKIKTQMQEFSINATNYKFAFQTFKSKTSHVLNVANIYFFLYSTVYSTFKALNVYIPHMFKRIVTESLPDPENNIVHSKSKYK